MFGEKLLARFNLCFFISMFGCVPSIVSAAVYSVPQASWRLGTSFDPLLPLDRFADCFEYDEEGRAAGRLDAGVTHWQIRRVESREDFYEQLGISASISASTVFGSGKAAADYSLAESFHSDSLTWVLVGKTTFNPTSASNLRLKQRYKRLSLDELKRRCGTEVVVSMKSQVQIAAIFTLSQIEQSRIENLKSRFSFQTSGFLAADVNASLESLVKAAASASAFQGKLFLVGGPGISELVDFQEHNGINWGNPAEAFARINDVINHYVPKMTFERAVPFYFETALIDRFITCPDRPIQAIIERGLNDLFFQYENIRSIENRLNDVIEHWPNYSKKVPLDYFRLKRDQYSSVRSKIIKEALQYFTEKRRESGNVRIAIRGDWLERITQEIYALEPIQWPVLKQKGEPVPEGEKVEERPLLKTTITSVPISSFSNSSQFRWDGTSFEDRMTMRQAVNDYCFGKDGYMGGFFNGHAWNSSLRVVCLRREIMEWKDRPTVAGMFGLIAFSKRAGRCGDLDWRHFAREAHNYCVKEGYVGGFHNGHVDDFSGRMGTICLKDTNAKTFFVPESKIFGTHSSYMAADREADHWCSNEGWVSGFFNGHEAVVQGERGFGVVCVK